MIIFRIEHLYKRQDSILHNFTTMNSIIGANLSEKDDIKLRNCHEESVCAEVVLLTPDPPQKNDKSIMNSRHAMAFNGLGPISHIRRW